MSDDSLFGGLKEQLGDYASTLGRKALNSAGGQVDKIADRLDGGGDSSSEAAKAGAEEIAEGKSPAKAALSAATTGAKDKIKGVFGGGSGGSGGSGDFKFSNIVETADVGVPLHVAYNAFTMFEDWPDFMKKVENVERTDDTKLSVKGQAVWSHRTWEATITEQVPDSHIVWESTGDKGYISGSVSFHQLAPRLTRIIAIGEYHKQGFVEGVGALWFTVPRRFRLELKFFVHHVMTEVMLDQEGVEGWRGEIRDGELVTSHEEGLERDEAEADEDAQADDESQSEDAQEPQGPDAEDEQTEEGEPVDEEPAEDEPAEDEPAEEEPVDEEPVEEEPADEAPPEEDDEPTDEAAPEEDAEPVEEYDEEYEEGDAPAEDEEYIDDAPEEEAAEAEPEDAADEEPAEYEESTEEEAER